MASHQDYMAYCIELAKRAGKLTKSNPMVGSVLVFEDKIIGEGYHEVFGQNHAERNAINDALSKYPELVKDATLYVTLEPCFHQGKTPPCANYIIENRIKKVVIGCVDPNPLVASQSIQFLKEHSVEIQIGVLEEECIHLIAQFKANLQKRPYVILKWAQSKDGYMGKKDQQIWISNEYSKILVHKWRSEIDAIMVGTQTAIQDNPALTTREWDGDNPIRVIPDFKEKVSKNSTVFCDGNKTIILNDKHNKIDRNIEYLKTQSTSINDYWTALYGKDIYCLMVEGGKRLLEEVIKSGHWDEARIITSSIKLNGGLRAPTLLGKLHQKQTLSDDFIVTILNDHS